MFFDQYKMLCDKVGKSPSAVGKEIGISSGAISMWKNGTRNPRTDQLTKIAAYFDVTIDYLLGNEKAATLEGDGQQPKGDISCEILRLFDQLSPAEQDKALAVLKALIDAQ